MKTVIQFIFIILSGSGIILGTVWLANLIREPEVSIRIERVPAQRPPCPENAEDFAKLRESKQFVKIIDNVRTYAKNGKFVSDQERVIKRLGKDEIACGYLYIRARKNGDVLEERFESVYVNPQDFGGHILTSRSIPIQTEKQKTEMLFPLRAIPFLPNLPFDPNAQNYRIADWAALLDVSDELRFHIGLSAADPRGVIEDITIAYKCWDPAQGKETQGCQLSLLNNGDQ